MNKGFTLVELLMAILLFVIVVTGIYSTFSVAVLARRRIAKHQEFSYELFLFSSLFKRDIDSCVALNNLYLIGESKRLYFFSSQVTGRGIRELRKITYFIKGDTLYRLVQSYPESLHNKGEEDIILDGISDFKMRYAYRGKKKIKWGKKWNGKYFPRFIEMTFSKGGSMWRKVFWCPVGEVGEEKQTR